MFHNPRNEINDAEALLLGFFNKTYHFMIAHHAIELFVNLLVLLLCVRGENIRARVHFGALRATLLLLVKSLQQDRKQKKGEKKEVTNSRRFKILYSSQTYLYKCNVPISFS